MGILLSETAENTSYSPVSFIIVWLVVIVVMFLMMSGPQKKEQKRIKAMLSSLEIGDSVLTTSGFYGMIIDISEDTVIVEFGNNKNCRIPMNKTAIAQVEKPGAE
ncbi:MAG: preprotein translocase subunit YajC [Lachnospiraceae bacterium]|nr:preprotein translocase subunit YajC [Lachnospiraceae bacterium]